jgi:hypothetical protein
LFYQESSLFSARYLYCSSIGHLRV